MARMYIELNDIKGIFYWNVLQRGKLYMKVPQGFEKFCSADVVLLLLKTTK